MKIKEKAEQYASKYWDENDDDFTSFGIGDMWCHYHNSYNETIIIKK